MSVKPWATLICVLILSTFLASCSPRPTNPEYYSIYPRMKKRTPRLADPVPMPPDTTKQERR